MKKRLLSITLCLCMLLTLLPAAAFAAGGNPATAEELTAAIKSAGEDETITLGDDIESADTIIVDKRITLDLAGHTLSFTTSNSYLSVSNQVTIQSTGSKGTITGVNKVLSVSGQFEIKDCNVEAKPVGSGAVTVVALNSGASVKANDCDFSIAKNDAASGIYDGFSTTWTNTTLELTDCTVDVSANSNVLNRAINVGSTNFKLTNCTLKNDRSDVATVQVSVMGSAEITGTTSITNAAAANNKALDIAYKSIDMLTISGNDVTVNGLVTLVGTQAKITIEGGKFYGLSGNVPGNFTIKGGLFKTDISQFMTAGQCVANTDEATKADYPYTVKAPEQAKIAYTVDAEGAYTYYGTLADAISAAEGSTVYLFADAGTVDPSALEGATISGNAAASITFSGDLNTVAGSLATAKLDNVNVVCDGVSVTGLSMENGKITAGSFPVDKYAGYAGLLADDRLFDGYVILTGTGTVIDVKDANSFDAKIGKVGYPTLLAAVTVASTNDASSPVKDEIVMLADYDGPVGVTAPKASFTLDMNGHKITSDRDYGFAMYPSGSASPNGADITVKNGDIEVTGENTIGVATNGTLSGVKLELIGVDVTSDTLAAYFPADGVYTLDGGSYTGKLTGVEIRAGSLTIKNDAKLTGGSDGECTVSGNSNGSTTANAALAIAQHTTGKLIAVKIESGTFEGSASISQADPQENGGKDVSTTVTGGTFTGDVVNDTAGSVSLSGATVTGDVTGSADGTTEIADSTVSGNIVNSTVDGKNLVAKYNNTSYETLSDALTAAKETGGTVYLLSDPASLESIPANVTLEVVPGVTVENDASLTNEGTIRVDSLMTIGSKGEVKGSGTIEVTANGKLEIKKDETASGKLGNNVTNGGVVAYEGDDAANISGTITLVSGGKVYSQCDISGKLSGPNRVLSDKNYGGTDYAYAWEYHTVPSYPSDGDSSTPSYSTSVENTVNGTVTVAPQNASKGSTVTITVKPNAGYVLDTLTVTDQNGSKLDLVDKGNGRYTFQMPAAKVTVKATFKAESSPLSFTDVSAGDWFYEAVKYACDNGMMNGVGNNLFAPGSNLTRAMICQVLYNLESTPAAGSGAFADVEAGQWYANAVNWAAAKGIVGGYGDGNFGPQDNITREQMAQILYNYAALKGYDISAQGDLSAFYDGANVSGWALSAMKWAVGTGLLQGYNGSLNPTGTATRAEVAQIFMNFCENIAK